MLKIVNNYKQGIGATGSLVLWATSVFYGWSIYGHFYPHGTHIVKGSLTTIHDSSPLPGIEAQLTSRSARIQATAQT